MRATLYFKADSARQDAEKVECKIMPLTDLAKDRPRRGDKSPVLVGCRELAAIVGHLRSEDPRMLNLLVNHRNTHGGEMLISDKPWLWDIIRDASDDVIIVKCSQVGVTETMLSEMFVLARQGYRGMYLLPTDAWRATFVADRLDRLLDKAPVYAAAVKQTGKETDAKTYKSIYGMGWRFAGTNNPRKESTPNAAFEFPADVLFIDERDKHDDDNLVYFYDRISRSPKRKIRRFGNPTVTRRGVWREWLVSDAKEYAVKCPSCGVAQALYWEPHFVERGGGWYQKVSTWPDPKCATCGAAMNRLSSGSWLPTNHSGNGASGYRLSRLFINVHGKDTDIEILWAMFVAARFDPTKTANLYNNYLCEPYEHAGLSITEADLSSASYTADSMSVLRRARADGMPVWAGVDQGKAFHVAVLTMHESAPRLVSAFEISDDFVLLASELDKLGVNWCVIDAGGGGYGATRRFVHEGDGRRMCRYVPKERITDPFKDNPEARTVEANRTETLDAVVAAIKGNLLLFPPDWRTMCGGALTRHLTALTRVVDNAGTPHWEGNGDDHLFHALAYAHLAASVFKLYEITDKVTDKQQSWRV
jgi:hypothetical protein